jgi:hypothetical protein
MRRHLVTGWFFAAVPAERTRAVRLLVFGYAAGWLLIRSRYVIDTAELPDRRFEGIGVWAGFDTPVPTAVVVVVLIVALGSCALAASGRAELVSAPVGAVTTLAVVTYTNSWGQVFHTENLLVLHLLVLGAATVIGASRSEGWPLRLMSILTVIAYMLAGWAKLDIGGTDWLSGDVLRNQVAFDNLRKILLGDVHSPLGGRLVGIAWLWAPVGVLTVIVELGAPIALLGGRCRTAWIGAVWLFHLGIVATMAILFPYPLSGIAFVSMVPAERVTPTIATLTSRARFPAFRDAARRRAGTHPTPRN